MSLSTPQCCALAWRIPCAGALGLSVACGGDAIITLGSGAPVATFGDAGQRIRNVNERTSNEAGATLTADLLEIYFASDRGDGPGEGDIWRAERAERSEPFGAPVLVMELSSPAAEASPAISADGLTLWFASSREPGLGQLDIWCSTRSERGQQGWAVPENVAALNSALNDLPRPPGDGGAVLPLASDREGGPYQTYLAHAGGAGFDDARLEPLTYLWHADAGMQDPFLSGDGRLLFFRRAPPEGAGDLYVAWRRPERAEFIDPALLPTINSPADERDPFLSEDQIRFFFSSAQRDGERLDVYATSIALPEFD